MLDRLKTILSNSHSDPQVDIEGEAVPVRIRRTAQARRISMRADVVKREIRITMPTYAPTKAAMDFVMQKRQWIAARLQSGPASASLAAGETVAVEGEPHVIVWNAGASRTIAVKEGETGRELHLGGPADAVEARIMRWLKAEAPGLLGSEAIKWNFTKFLVGRDGKVIKRYAPNDEPEKLRADIEAALAK